MYIKQAREKTGLSQKQLAEKLGVSQPTVSDWESGRKNPTHENLIAISKLLGCSLDALLFGKQPGATPSDDDIKFALFGEHDIDDDMFIEVKNFARYLKQKKGGGAS